jgi:hypothetical protein
VAAFILPREPLEPVVLEAVALGQKELMDQPHLLVLLDQLIPVEEVVVAGLIRLAVQVLEEQAAQVS